VVPCECQHNIICLKYAQNYPVVPVYLQTCNCTEMYRCKVQGNHFRVKSKDFNEFGSLLNWVIVSEYHALLVENAFVPFTLSFCRI
jgi:hypothetical protein